MSEEESHAAITDNGDAHSSAAHDESSRGRGRGRGRGADGHGRGRGRGSAGKGRGRGRGGASSTGDEEHAAADESTPAADGEDVSVTEDGTGESSRGRGRGRGRGGRGRGAARPPRPLREVPVPDEDAWQSSQRAHSTLLSELNVKIDAFTTKIEAAVKVRKGMRDELKKQQAALESLTTDKMAIFQRYNAMKDHIASIDSASIERRRDLEAARKELDFHTVLELDQAIKQLEKQLNTRALVIAEERKVLEEIKRMRSLRPRVLDYERKSQETGSSQEELDALVSEREEAHRTAYAKKGDEDRQRRHVDELHGKEKALTDDIEGNIAKRRALITQRQHEEREFSIKEDAHAQQLRDYESYVKEKSWREGEAERRHKEQADYEARQARRQRIADERAERAELDRAYREQRDAEEAAKDPYETEKHTISELLKYVDKLSIKSSQDDVDDGNDEKQSELLSQRLAAFNGKDVKPLTSAKSQKDSIFQSVVQPSKVKRSKPKKITRVLTHVPDVFQMFISVQVDPPLLTSELESTREKLKEREDYYATAPKPLRKGKGKRIDDEEDDPDVVVIREGGAVDAEGVESV